MRVNANALILRDGYVLLVKIDDENGIHYNLPGGKVEKGETLYEGLIRECLEEVGIEVNVKELVLSWEYVPEKENYTYGKKTEARPRLSLRSGEGQRTQKTHTDGRKSDRLRMGIARKRRPGCARKIPADLPPYRKRNPRDH